MRGIRLGTIGILSFSAPSVTALPVSNAPQAGTVLCLGGRSTLSAATPIAQRTIILTTVKRIGKTIPQSVLIRADEVTQ